MICVDKSRYARDWFRLIHSLPDQYSVEAALQAIGFCQRSRFCALAPRRLPGRQAALSRQVQPAPAIPAVSVYDLKYHVPPPRSGSFRSMRRWVLPDAGAFGTSESEM